MLDEEVLKKKKIWTTWSRIKRKINKIKFINLFGLEVKKKINFYGFTSFKIEEN